MPKLTQAAGSASASPTAEGFEYVFHMALGGRRLV